MSYLQHRRKAFAAGGGGEPAFGGSSRYWDAYTTSCYGVISSAPAELDLVGGDFSVAFWMKNDNTNANPYIIEFNDSNSNVWSVYRYTASNFAMRVDEGGSLVTNRRTTSNPISTDTWIHCVVTFTNSTSAVAFYTDDSAALTQTSNNYNRGNTTRTTFGIRTDLSSATIGKYKAADLRVYSKVLDATDRTNLFEGTHVSDSLVGWWFLDSDDMNDNSGNGNDISQASAPPDDVIFSTDGPFD